MSFRIEHRIGVAAPASVLWDVITDFARWGEWNPIYPKIEGRLSIGGPVSFELHLPNRPVREFKGTFVDWVPQTQLIWSLKLAGGLIRTTRYIEIEKLEEAEAACILANGEIFDGMGVGLFPKADKPVIRRAFELVNMAAKARAEDIYKAGSGG